MNSLIKAIANAEHEARRTGKDYAVLNLNTVGEALYVVREYRNNFEIGPFSHQFVHRAQGAKEATNG